MATEHESTGVKTLTLSKKEITDIVGLLFAQVADEPLVGNQHGACPVIVVQNVDSGVITHYEFVAHPDLLDGVSRQFVDSYATVLAMSPKTAVTFAGALMNQITRSHLPRNWQSFTASFRALSGEMVKYTIQLA